MAKMSRKELRKLVLEMAHADSDDGVKTFNSDEEGGISNMPDKLRIALDSDNLYAATEIMTSMEIEKVPDLSEVANALYDGFILDVSNLEGPMPATAKPLNFYAVIQGDLILVGNMSLEDGISLSLGEHHVVVYPASLKDFN